ncbi:MAG: acyl-CoA dehydrogenase [Dehalococcoidia bacterium]|nr:acyl-CoA dehydrogenase [Dehalococcoidia bacterium]
MMTSTERTKEAVLNTARSLQAVIEGHRDESERERRLSPAIVAAMREAGLFNSWVPRELGGDEVDLPTFLEVVEAISAMDGAAGWVLANVTGNNMQAAFLPQAGAREILGGDQAALSVGAIAPKGHAVPVAGGYRLTGQWPLVSGAHHATWLGMGSLVFDGDAPRLGVHGMPDLKIMCVPAAECEVLDTWYAAGLRGTGSTDIAVRDVFVPEQRTFSAFTGQPQVPGALYQVGILALFSCALTAVGLGIARAAIDAFVELAKGKTPTLSQAGLGGRPTVHAEVAHAEARLQSARAYFFEVAREMMAVVEAGEAIPEDLEARRQLACVNSAASCEEAVDSMFKLGGSTAIYSGHRLERCLRDIHTANQHLVVSPVWWEKTGQYYFGLGLGMP